MKCFTILVVSQLKLYSVYTLLSWRFEILFCDGLQEGAKAHQLEADASFLSRMIVESNEKGCALGDERQQ